MKTIQIKLDEPHEGQGQVLDQAKRFNVLECGRRWGKTTLGKYCLIEPILNGERVGWFAPTYKYLDDVWREVVACLAPTDPLINVQQKRIETLTHGVAEFWSLDEPNPGRGRKYHRVIIDEAGIVRNLDDAWTNAIRPTLADYKGDAWFLGTPKGRNYFHQLFSRGEAKHDGWASWRLPTTNNPSIDPNEIEAARRDMPEAAFKQEFLGIPADDGGNPFNIASIRACSIKSLAPGPAVCFGVDLAKSVDWTVVLGLNAQGETCVLERWQSDWGQTRRRVLDLIGQTTALVDATGVGDPIVEDLQREGRRVEAFKFTSSSKQQIMEGLAAAFQREQIKIPEGWLQNECESFEYHYTPSGGVKYGSPDGLHDDGACALALAVSKWSRPIPKEARSRVFFARGT